MAEYSCVRCLFCNTGRENAVARSVEQNGWGRAIFAERIKTIRRDGQTIETFVPLLPGYVFVYSDKMDTARRDELLGLRSVIRVLSYDAGGHDGLTGRDLEFADWLWRVNGRIGLLKALQVGDRIEIVDGILKQLHGTITKMDKRKRTVRIALDTEGAIREIWLAYDVVEKLDAKPEGCELAGETKGDGAQRGDSAILSKQ